LSAAMAKLDSALDGQDFFLGGKATTADFALMPFIRVVSLSEPALLDDVPNLKSWLEKMLELDSFKKAMSYNNPTP
jgi:glutathione S-transferase